MYETLNRLFDKGDGPLDENGLNNAVLKGWITEEQKQEIISTNESR